MTRALLFTRSLWLFSLALAGAALLGSPGLRSSARTSLPPDALAPFDTAVFSEMNIRAQGDRAPVLVYPEIAASRPSGTPGCAGSELDSDLRWLLHQGAHFISIGDLQRHLTTGSPLPPNPVALTFDAAGPGFRDYGYPVLERYRCPAAAFVAASGSLAMDPGDLRRLDRGGLVTFGVAAPAGLPVAGLVPPSGAAALADAKRDLERALGHPVPYLASPALSFSSALAGSLRRAGFTMAFTGRSGPSEESSSILAVDRYDRSRLADAWSECACSRLLAPAAVVEQNLRPSSIRLEMTEAAGVKLGIVRGGAPTTRRSSGRRSVGEFVREAGGAAGINGTFFTDAEIRSVDNVLIGPSQTMPDRVFYPELAPDRLARLTNRPMVVWGPGRIALFPFQPGTMNDPAAVRRLMPDYTDAFVAGAWIVHDGRPRTEEELKPYAVDNCEDPRRRAFFGFTDTGKIVLGASLEVVSSARLARAAAAAGVKEAVLLDSGFSTSLIYGDRIIVTGHTAPRLPSRPVPHAIVLLGTLAEPASSTGRS